MNPAEQQAFGVAREERAAWFDEALPLVRRLWTEDAVDHDGARFHYEGLRVLPKPVQQPPDVWLGGKAPGELRRVGRLGDGWLASFATPDVCAAGRPVIEEAAADGGARRSTPSTSARWSSTRTARSPSRSRADRVAQPRTPIPTSSCPSTLDALERQLERYIARDFSKLVLVPLAGARRLARRARAPRRAHPRPAELNGPPGVCARTGESRRISQARGVR